MPVIDLLCLATLFANEGISEKTAAGIAVSSAALGGIFTKGLEMLLTHLRARRTDEEKGHAFVLGEMQKLMDSRQKEWQGLIDSHQAKILRAEERIEKIQAEHVACLQENAVLKERVSDLEGEVTVIRARLAQVESTRENPCS